MSDSLRPCLRTYLPTRIHIYDIRRDSQVWSSLLSDISTTKHCQMSSGSHLLNVEASGNTKLELNWMLDQCFQILWNISSPNQMFSRNIRTEQLFVIYHSNHSQYILMFLHLNCGILDAFCVFNHMLNIFSITLIVLNPIHHFFCLLLLVIMTLSVPEKDTGGLWLSLC